jgi:hypothetical protein
MKASKAGTATLTIAGKWVETVKIEMHLTGWLAPLCDLKGLSILPVIRNL